MPGMPVGDLALVTDLRNLASGRRSVDSGSGLPIWIFQRCAGKSVGPRPAALLAHMAKMKSVPVALPKTAPALARALGRIRTGG